MITAKELARVVYQKLHGHLVTFDLEQKDVETLEKAFDQYANQRLEEAAQTIEDERFEQPCREAEWSRLIARRVRAMKREQEKG